MTSYSVTSFKNAISEVPGRFCANSNSEKLAPWFPSGRPSHASHQCREASNSSRLHPSERHGNMYECQLKFENYLDFLCIHVYGKTFASVQTTGQHRPDEVFNKATRGQELQSFRRQGNTFRTRTLLWKLRAAKL